MPFGLQPLHLLVILVVALLIFGPSRLPEIGRAFGKTIREFQSATKEATQGLSEELGPKSGETKAEVKKEEPKKEEPAMVACKNCGKSMQAGMRFCPHCGTEQ